MTFRAIFLADGPSDLPLASHLEVLCARAGSEVQVTAVDPRSIRPRSRSVEDRIRFLLHQGVRPGIVFVHRDAENESPTKRAEEIFAGCSAAGVDEHSVVPVVPVRMTEAWLLLDEPEIRRVAGRPSGRFSLSLPPPSKLETVADPKWVLQQALLLAGDPGGQRRRKHFVRDFGRHRMLLLQRLDIDGPVNHLPSWQRLRDDVDRVVKNLESG